MVLFKAKLRYLSGGAGCLIMCLYGLRGNGVGPVRGCMVWRLHVTDREKAVARVFGERMRAG